MTEVKHAATAETAAEHTAQVPLNARNAPFMKTGSESFRVFLFTYWSSFSAAAAAAAAACRSFLIQQNIFLIQTFASRCKIHTAQRSEPQPEMIDNCKLLPFPAPLFKMPMLKHSSLENSPQ